MIVISSANVSNLQNNNLLKVAAAVCLFVLGVGAGTWLIADAIVKVRGY